MFLLTRDTIAKNITRKELSIGNADMACYGSTFYYFRLGSSIRLWASGGQPERGIELSREPNEAFVLPPGAFATVMSYETFSCSDRIFGLFGQNTDLALEQGLQLVHGPTVDPHFSNPLKLGLKNLLDDPVTVRLKQRLGKIMFFDVSDTYPVGDHGQDIMRAFASRGTV